MTTHTTLQLDEAEHHRILVEELPLWTAGAVPQEQPVVVIVAGPPGSGKTTAADVIEQVLSWRGGAVRIGSDMYKRAHRAYGTLLEQDVRTAGAAVRPDTRLWRAEVEKYARAARLDVVLELALADVAEARHTSTVYRAAGYRVELVLVAVAEADSALARLERFFGPEEDGGGRYVSWANADDCTAGLPDVLARIEAERLVDRVAVVRRGLHLLYDNELVDGVYVRPVAAAEAVRAEWALPWDAPRSRVFGRRLVRAEVRVHDERLSADRRLAVSRDAERAAAAAEPVRRIAHPVPGPPGTGYHRLSAAEHQLFYDELIAPTYLRRPVSRDNPVVVYLVGGPGTDMLQAGWLVKRAMRPGVTRLVPEKLQGVHPDYLQLLTDEPRTAGEKVAADTLAWMARAQASLRERQADMLIDAEFACGYDFLDSVGRDRRAGYRVEVVAIASRLADSRQRAAVDHARAAELDIPSPFPTAAAHTRSFVSVVEIVAAAEASELVSAVTVLDRGHHAVHRHQAGQGSGKASWSLTAEQWRPYTEAEAYRFFAVDRALTAVMPRYRPELEDIVAQARPMMPARFQPHRIPHQPSAASALPVRAGGW